MLGYTNFHTEGKYFFIPQQKSLLKNVYFNAICLLKQPLMESNVQHQVIYRIVSVQNKRPGKQANAEGA
jgi:hypothetical protein